jgi:aminopeptidase-like protein
MTTMMDWINETWFLRRDIVSDGYDQALTRLAREVPMTIHEYPSGEPCWTWKIPEKWTCHAAYLETLDGRRVLDTAEHPLHVVSYSLPFEGIVAREVLLPHVHTHPKRPGAIPFVFKYYDRDWGLCATQAQKDSLTEDAYRVVIRTAFEPGSLKVGEIVVPGESEQCVVLVSHLCHPAMVNDDLAGVVVTLDVARTLLTGPRPHFTYRFLILPETIGSVAYLSRHEALIPRMVGGLFLEMLGNDSPHALQGSFQPESQFDRCLCAALRSLDPAGYADPYRTVVANDERQFNAPGVRVPMLSLSRVERPESPTRPYPEYHSSDDTPAIVTQDRLAATRDLVLGMIAAWENNQYVVNNFKGEVFCSGYGIWVDYRTNPEGHRLLFRIMDRCDGEHTVADIASELSATFETVWGIVALLQSKGLVWLSRTPRPTDPHKQTPEVFKTSGV